MTCGTASSYSLPSCPKDSNHLSRWGGLSASKRSCHSDARNETNEVICTLFSETMNQIGCQRRSTLRFLSEHLLQLPPGGSDLLAGLPVVGVMPGSCWACCCWVWSLSLHSHMAVPALLDKRMEHSRLHPPLREA